MHTLIELYDERAIENVLGAQTFHPAKVIYLCPGNIASDRRMHAILNSFFESQGMSPALEFIECSMYKADKIYEQLVKIHSQNEDMAIDITGGNDAALFAAGMFCKQNNIPAFTYSRRSNHFYNILDADFADNVPCQLTYSVSDFFRMTGGRMRKGRVDNKTLHSYSRYFDEFFNIYLEHKRKWPDMVTFFQRISWAEHGEYIPLSIHGSLEQKGEHGHKVYGDKKLLNELMHLGFIKNLKYDNNNGVSFEFMDEQARSWLRDVGSALELFMYQQCEDTGIFNDVISSAIVDWDGTVSHDSVSNEIDVVASRGIVPLFISCKACEIKTEALNELAILKERFGGKGAKACIVTTENCNAAARHRAAQLGIAVIDIEEIMAGEVVERLKVIMKSNKQPQ